MNGVKPQPRLGAESAVIGRRSEAGETISADSATPAAVSRRRRTITEGVGFDRERQQGPILRVVKGDATPEEVAALVAVIASLSGGEATGRVEAAQHLGRPCPTGATTLPHGPGAWRSSGLPH